MFNSIKLRRPNRNKFNLSHERKMSFNMGYLVPCMMQEIVPGDSFRVNTEVMVRFAPLLAPIMHRVNVWVHYFFVPNRLIWDEWEDFVTGGRLGTSLPVHPTVSYETARQTRFVQGTLADYLGIPVCGTDPITNPISLSALPFRAYTLCYDEYFRDQNLTASVDISKASGAMSAPEQDKIMILRKRAWEKDYFTSALPFAQRGGAVEVPGSPNYKATTDIISPTPPTVANPYVVGAPVVGNSSKLANATGNVRVENLESIGVDVNELRRSIRLQEWLEKNARGGARYVEQILSHFGVKSSDARLQRPEYLGGGKTPVVISEVLATSTLPGDVESNPIPQGNMAGHGVSFGSRNGFKRSFEEHGFVVGLMSVLPRTAYQQGIDKMWSRFDKFDYYWPEFANIGEQEVMQREIYYDPDSGPVADSTFGYQSRYAEYKYKPSTVHGSFRSDLAFWHMGRIFASAPALNESFIEADPTIRIFAVDPEASGTYSMWCHMYNRVDALRPMPYFGTPTL